MINNEEGQKQALHICFVNNVNNDGYNLTKTTIMKTLQIKRILVFVLALASSSYGIAQLNSKAIQRSAIVKSTPYECQGYVLFHPTPRVVQLNAIATIEDQNLFILPTEVTSIVGFDHLRLPKSVWGNPDFSYKIQGLGIDGKVVVEEDHTPPADPNNNSHYLNNCNRPTCNAGTMQRSQLMVVYVLKDITIHRVVVTHVF